MDLVELGERIKKYRSKTKLSQEKFALKIDMDRTYFAAIEKGKHNVTIGNLAKICEGLGISLSTLLKNM